MYIKHIVYIEFQTAYQHKISQLWNNVPHPRNEPGGILKDIPNPQLILAAAPISVEDFNIVSLNSS